MTSQTERANTVEKAALVREMLRTLSRMPVNPRTDLYWRLFSTLAVELYGSQMHPFVHPRHQELHLLTVDANRRNDLRGWLADAPQFAFSLLVGLMSEDDEMAWGLAYG